jgi:general secretion pathway protein K
MRTGRSASILVIVMITLVLTAAALVAFLDRASNDLLVDARSAEAARLRPDAYSALEVVLGVLDEFRSADNGLHHPSESWADPLGWAGWAPTDGYTVDVAFQDESGKIPLNRVTTTELMNLFQYWGMSQVDAQKLTDSIYSWMHQNYTPTSALITDYEQAAIPYDPPYRAIRSIGELAAIDDARDYFYTNGQPNAWWWRFYQDFSVYNYTRPNINGANSDVLSAVGQFTLEQEQGIAQYLAGTSDRSTAGRTWFQATPDLQTAIGSLSGNPGAFGFTVSALRILITVHDAKASFRLAVVVAPGSGGANTVETTATDIKQSQQNAQTGETNNATQVTTTAAPTTAPNTAQTSAAQAANIQYPFRFLDIEENENIPNVPPLPVTDAPDPAAPPVNPFSPVVPPLPTQ